MYEKLFLTQEKERYHLLLLDEKNPNWCVNHKSHMTKVFLCAVARPQYNPCVISWWDGKLEIWPIGDWEPAKWKSKNRPKGALVWKNKTVNIEVYRDLHICKLLLAIIEKWLRRDRLSRKIFIPIALLTLTPIN